MNYSPDIRQTLEESVDTTNKSLEYLHYDINEDKQVPSLSLSETQQKRETVENNELRTAKQSSSSRNENANIYNNETKIDSTTCTSERETEILKFNNSLQTTKYEKIYYYYWKLDKTNNTWFEEQGYLQSMDFYMNSKETVIIFMNTHLIKCILGFQFYLHLIPHYLNTKYVGVRLYSSTKRFIKHRFTLLNQCDSKGDLSSQMLVTNYRFASLYKICSDKLQNASFIHKNSLIIMVSIFFNF